MLFNEYNSAVGHLESRQYSGNINRMKNKFYINSQTMPLKYIFMLGSNGETYKLLVENIILHYVDHKMKT